MNSSQMDSGPLVIRVDASVEIGTGHVTRCLALAQAWQDAGGRTVFAVAESPSAIRARLSLESLEVVDLSCTPGTAEDASLTVALAQERRSRWIAVDGYRFGSDYQRDLKAAGSRVLFIDDYGHAPPYSANVILNQNVSASAELYADREPQTRLLLGPHYCLLRHEFAAWRDWKREVSPLCHRVLVMMGGSDPENLTARVIEALCQAGLDLQATVVAGGSNPHFPALQNAAAHSGLKITLLQDVANVAELMAAADVAVSAAGSTCWELCLLGLPALLLDVAANQTALAKELDRSGCAIHVGDRTVSANKIAKELQRLCGAHELRHSLSRRSRELVDGKGAARVVSFLCGPERMRLRRVVGDDQRLLWDWANDPAVRAASFSPDPISWETHVAWFSEKLSSKKSVILVAEDGDAAPVGQIRFDARSDGEWDVDVSIDRALRGCGLASQLIRLGMQVLREQDRGARVHAFVMPENLASIRAFERSAFRQEGIEKVRGYAAIHLVCDGR